MNFVFACCRVIDYLFEVATNDFDVKLEEYYVCSTLFYAKLKRLILLLSCLFVQILIFLFCGSRRHRQRGLHMIPFGNCYSPF
jgi:hypothetical protein